MTTLLQTTNEKFFDLLIGFFPSMLLYSVLMSSVFDRYGLVQVPFGSAVIIGVLIISVAWVVTCYKKERMGIVLGTLFGTVLPIIIALFIR